MVIVLGSRQKNKDFLDGSAIKLEEGGGMGGKALMKLPLRWYFFVAALRDCGKPAVATDTHKYLEWITKVKKQGIKF